MGPVLPGDVHSGPVVSLQGATVTWPGNPPALREVSLSIRPGEFVSLVGQTGAGKSSLLKLLYREIKASAGGVTVFGRNLNLMTGRDVPLFRRRLGIVFQDFGLLPNKTAYENVAYALQVIGEHRRAIRKRVPEALDLVSMAHRPEAFPAELSGGEQQRVAIARALVNRPALLLADEPTGNLDPATSAGIGDLLSFVNQQGTTVLVATHDAMMVDRLQKRVVELRLGAVIRDEPNGSYGVIPDDGETAAGQVIEVQDGEPQGEAGEDS